MAARHRSRKRKSFSIPISMGVQTPSTRLSCFLAAAAACMIKEIESVSRRERGDIDKWRGSQLGMIRAGHSLKHQAGASSPRSASEPLSVQRKTTPSASRALHEWSPEAQTTGATDTKAPEARSRGHSQTLFYNTVRPHTSLGGLSPSMFANWSPEDQNPARPNS